MVPHPLHIFDIPMKISLLDYWNNLIKWSLEILDIFLISP
jgi:hypothetical protein